MLQKISLKASLHVLKLINQNNYFQTKTIQEKIFTAFKNYLYKFYFD